MTNTPFDPDFLCCDVSEAMNEPIFGTAVTAAVWFMLTYTRPWSAKATSDNELAVPIQEWLAAQVQATNGRLQFIRQFQTDVTEITFFLGFTNQRVPRLYEFRLSAYEDLLDLDVAAVSAGDSRFDAHLVTGHRYFICTNGKRDRSCAVQGAALYRTFTQPTENHVWMTTHLGGHRFAPTVLTLPDGICHGRVRPGDIGQLIAHTQRSERWLEKYRGHTALSPVAQVADYYLRRETGENAAAAYAYVTTATGDGCWQVAFQGQDSKTVQVTLAPAEPLAIYASSGQLKQKEVPQYRLVGIES